MERVIALIDMDCFFVQVEQRPLPELTGKPCAVTQYNTYKGGGIIAVNYEARAFGVKRGMRGDEAQQKCPDIVLFHTPQKRGKADSSKYRQASFEVFDVLTNFHPDIVVEKASIDEAFLDLTKYVTEHRHNIDLEDVSDLRDSYVAGVVEIGEQENQEEGQEGNVQEDKQKQEEKEEAVASAVRVVQRFQEAATAPNGNQNDLNLLLAAKIVGRMRRAVLEKTSFHCSAGISHNKILAKLAAGINKPRAQTILSRDNVKTVLDATDIEKLRHFGGKLGNTIKQYLSVSKVGEINQFPFSTLCTYFGDKNARFIQDLSNGIDDDQVVARKMSKSIACGKNFSAVGTKALVNREQIVYWISQLVDELLERLELDREMNNRKPTLLIVGIAMKEMTSKSLPFTSFDKQKLIDIIMEKALDRLFVKEPNLKDPIRMLSVSATKFVDIDSSSSTLDTFFSKVGRDQYLEASSSKEISRGTSSRTSDSKASSTVTSEKVCEISAPIPLEKLDCKSMMLNYFTRMEKELFVREDKKSEQSKTNNVSKYFIEGFKRNHEMTTSTSTASTSAASTSAASTSVLPTHAEATSTNSSTLTEEMCLGCDRTSPRKKIKDFPVHHERAKEIVDICEDEEIIISTPPTSRYRTPVKRGFFYRKTLEFMKLSKEKR